MSPRLIRFAGRDGDDRLYGRKGDDLQRWAGTDLCAQGPEVGTELACEQ